IEALIGFLYLEKREELLYALLNTIITIVNER
ncbi:ribonuclease III, partial [Pseudomonas aeruginosa]|nr:ribonuclease III [Pseudomonas aeruginosa]